MRAGGQPPPTCGKSASAATRLPRAGNCLRPGPCQTIQQRRGWFPRHRARSLQPEWPLRKAPRMYQRSPTAQEYSCRFNQRGKSSKILETVDPGIVPIAPPGLQSISAYNIEARQLKAVVGIGNVRSQNIAQNVGFTAAGRARTGAPQKLQIEIRLRAIVPSNGELVSDLLNVRRLQSHGPLTYHDARLGSNSRTPLTNSSANATDSH
jgi:hypothetical protein